MASKLGRKLQVWNTLKIEGEEKFERDCRKNSDIMATTPAQEISDGQIVDPTKTRKSYTWECAVYNLEFVKFYHDNNLYQTAKCFH